MDAELYWIVSIPLVIEMLEDDTRYVYPIGSMYGIFTYIYQKNQPNVGRYIIHGSYRYVYVYWDIYSYILFCDVLCVMPLWFYLCFPFYFKSIVGWHKALYSPLCWQQIEKWATTNPGAGLLAGTGLRLLHLNISVALFLDFFLKPEDSEGNQVMNNVNVQSLMQHDKDHLFLTWLVCV